MYALYYQSRDPNPSIKIHLKTLVTNEKPYSCTKVTLCPKNDSWSQIWRLTSNLDIIDASAQCLWMLDQAPFKKDKTIPGLGDKLTNFKLVQNLFFVRQRIQFDLSSVFNQQKTCYTLWKWEDLIFLYYKNRFLDCFKYTICIFSWQYWQTTPGIFKAFRWPFYRKI